MKKRLPKSLQFKRRLGFAAFAPCIGLFYVLVTMAISGILYELCSKRVADVWGRSLFLLAMVVWVVGMMVGMVAFLFCGHHMNHNLRMNGWLKLKWQFAGVFWPVTTPLYWYHFIWKEK